MTSPLYHGAVLCVSHTAADYGPTNHCRIDPVDGGRARDNGANIQNLHVAIYGVLLMKKRHFSSIACLMTPWMEVVHVTMEQIFRTCM